MIIIMNDDDDEFQVEAGKVALLECRVTHLSPHHTVSWLRLFSSVSALLILSLTTNYNRSEDVSVLTVGGLVFSSDPRLHVVTRSRSDIFLQMTIINSLKNAEIVNKKGHKRFGR